MPILYTWTYVNFYSSAFLILQLQYWKLNSCLLMSICHFIGEIFKELLWIVGHLRKRIVWAAYSILNSRSRLTVFFSWIMRGLWNTSFCSVCIRCFHNRVLSKNNYIHSKFKWLPELGVGAGSGVCHSVLPFSLLLLLIQPCDLFTVFATDLICFQVQCLSACPLLATAIVSSWEQSFPSPLLTCPFLSFRILLGSLPGGFPWPLHWI